MAAPIRTSSHHQLLVACRDRDALRALFDLVPVKAGGSVSLACDVLGFDDAVAYVRAGDRPRAKTLIKSFNRSLVATCECIDRADELGPLGTWALEEFAKRLWRSRTACAVGQRLLAHPLATGITRALVTKSLAHLDAELIPVLAAAESPGTTVDVLSELARLCTTSGTHKGTLVLEALLGRYGSMNVALPPTVYDILADGDKPILRRLVQSIGIAGTPAERRVLHRAMAAGLELTDLLWEHSSPAIVESALDSYKFTDHDLCGLVCAHVPLPGRVIGGLVDSLLAAPNGPSSSTSVVAGSSAGTIASDYWHLGPGRVYVPTLVGSLFRQSELPGHCFGPLLRRFSHRGLTRSALMHPNCPASVALRAVGAPLDVRELPDEAVAAKWLSEIAQSGSVRARETLAQGTRDPELLNLLAQSHQPSTVRAACGLNPNAPLLMTGHVPAAPSAASRNKLAAYYASHFGSDKDLWSLALVLMDTFVGSAEDLVRTVVALSA